MFGCGVALLGRVGLVDRATAFGLVGYRLTQVPPLTIPVQPNFLFGQSPFAVLAQVTYPDRLSELQLGWQLGDPRHRLGFKTLGGDLLFNFQKNHKFPPCAGKVRSASSPWNIFEKIFYLKLFFRISQGYAYRDS